MTLNGSGAIVAKQERTYVTLPAELAAGLDELVAATRVRKAEYIREAIADLLKKYDAVLREARKKQKSKP